MVGLGEAEALTGLPGRDGAQARRWHVCQAGSGTRLVCLESLRAATRRAPVGAGKDRYKSGMNSAGTRTGGVCQWDCGRS